MFSSIVTLGRKGTVLTFYFIACEFYEILVTCIYILFGVGEETLANSNKDLGYRILDWKAIALSVEINFWHMSSYVNYITNLLFFISIILCMLNVNLHENFTLKNFSSLHIGGIIQFLWIQSLVWHWHFSPIRLFLLSHCSF